MDLEVSPGLTIPTSELGWRFSRSSGPGGQHVNTSDSRVELSWNVSDSAALSEGQRLMLLTRLGRRITAGVITVTASERRSQLRNREIALAKLADLVAEGLAPETAPAGRPNPPAAPTAGALPQRNNGRPPNGNDSGHPRNSSTVVANKRSAASSGGVQIATCHHLAPAPEVERRRLQVDVEQARFGASGTGGKTSNRFIDNLAHGCGNVHHYSGFVGLQFFKGFQL